MPITDSSYTIRSSRFNTPSPKKIQDPQVETEQAMPREEFTFSGGDKAGWKIAGMTTMLAAVPVGVAAKNFGAGAMVGLVGLALMFGPDN